MCRDAKGGKPPDMRHRELPLRVARRSVLLDRLLAVEEEGLRLGSERCQVVFGAPSIPY